jgi:hypothetical protein
LTHGLVLRDGGGAIVTKPTSEGNPISATVTLTAADGRKVSWLVTFTDAADAADAARLPEIVERMEAKLDAEKPKPSGFSCRGYGPDPLSSNA